MDVTATETLILAYRQLGDQESLAGAWNHLQSITALTAQQWLTRMEDRCVERPNTADVQVWKRYLEIRGPSVLEEAREACKWHLGEGWQLWTELSQIPPLGVPYTCCNNGSDLLEISQQVRTWEEQLMATNKSWESFKTYLGGIDTLNLPPESLFEIKRTIFQRALDTKGLIHNEMVWLEYLDLISFQRSEFYGSIVRTAINSCRQSIKLRTQALLLAESTGSWTAMEQALAVALRGYDPATFDELVQLHLSYCVAARRLFWLSNPEAARRVFQEVSDTINRLGSDSKIRGYWMRLEYLSGDLKMGRMLREQLGKVNRNDLRWWLGATYLEISAREYDEARNLFKEALAVILPESTSRLLSEWEQLELQNGTLETWLDFVQIAKKYPRDEKIFDRPMQKKRTEEPLVVNKLLEKRGKVSPVESKEPEYDPKTTVFLNNLSFKATEQDIKTFLGQLVETEPSHVVISHDKSGKSRGLAHAVFSSEILVQKTIAQDRTLFMGRPLFISEYQPIPKTERRRIEYQTGRDPKVLFVSHLADETTKEDIDALFSGRNGFKASRLVITKAGHFKGAAYVEFEDEPSASQALGVDGTDLRGSRIRVQISDPKLAKSRAARLQMVPRAVQASKHARPRIQKT